ncbi:Isonitrile hydratase 4 [Colletotrichum chlorophyti]|uniref:Isonitrile hydratase 4 n=1 Tax=Colletotrichum chlorophyti TaxID=708187 RepID=A0A1Q8S0T8_9PEZI|nr:Isonitrile hydratase 4 [Colletotrichum chlorophyti]
MTNNKTVKIGVFVPSECQLLDMACVDVLWMASKEYLGPMDFLPRHLAELAPSVRIFYITSTPGSPESDGNNTPKLGPGLLQLTAGVRIQTTHDILDPEVQPGKLDVVLVPGPDPGASWGEDVLEFLRGHAARHEETDVLSVCTGIFLCGAAGLLEGKTVCGPRGVQDMLKGRYPGVKFVGEKFRWYQDGNLWTCGGITNGNDLVAAYIRSSSRHFPAPIAEIACQMADVGERGQLYGQGQASFFLGFFWQVVKAWFVRPSKVKNV